MHPRTKAKTKDITKLTIDLVANGLMTWAVLGSPKIIGKYEKVLGASNAYIGARVRETLKRLHMQNMIRYDKDDEKSPIMLTEKGMQRLASHRFKDSIKNIFRKKKKWDYFWRIIFFDIPEEKKYIRDHLRKELLSLGFYQFQKSVYVCPFDCEDMLLDFCSAYGISNDVLFCVTPSLGRKEQEVRNHFFRRKGN